MTDQQQEDLRKDEIEAGATTGLASPSVDPLSARQNSLWSDAWGSLKRNVLFWIGAFLTLVLVLVLQIVGQFQIFGQAQLMTNGGPAGATRTLVLYIYDTAFRDWLVAEGARSPSPPIPWTNPGG